MSTTTTTTSDTSAIDDKKNNVSGININQQTILQYIKAVFPSIIRAFIYFTLGSLVLYGTFSAQSGIFIIHTLKKFLIIQKIVFQIFMKQMMVNIVKNYFSIMIQIEKEIHY